MKIVTWSKRHIDILLIIAGVSVIVFSMHLILKPWIYQNVTLKRNVKAAESRQAVDSEDTSPNSKNVNRLLLNDYDSKVIKRGEYKSGMMTIDILKLGVHAGVINGTTTKDLKLGPALFEISPLPNVTGGNVCIAAHRDRWFKAIDKLNKDDEIILTLSGKKYVYKVEKIFIVAKNDWSVTHNTGYSALTLVTCISATNSEKRIILRAKLDNG
ncbi:MAG TPA: hypothetical protein DD426_00710 [Clostridiaceae bacterium]|nr:hypothetical protein [Clostridiaceae bacterium]